MHKENISNLRKNRGWNVDSIVFQIECILKTCNVEEEAYHGGQFNGVSCRKILDNIESIMQETEKVVISERKKPSKISDKGVLTKLKSYEKLFQMMDATLSQMNIMNPTQLEIKEFENRKNEMMKLWRKLNISITTKAHLLEHHAHQQLKEFKGIMDKVEHHVEREHQVGLRLLALTRNIRRYEDRTLSQLKNMEIVGHSEVKWKQK